jgi:putative Ca2+/H+ antiporter (TMEM165/GDT1 family)
MVTSVTLIPNYDIDIFLRSLVMVSVAELFDKTWFMGLILALRHDKRTVFCGSFTALFLHCIIAAGLGAAAAWAVPLSYLSWAAFSLFALFTLLYTRDFINADPDGDVIAAGREEAEEETASLLAEEGKPGESIIGVHEEPPLEKWNLYETTQPRNQHTKAGVPAATRPTAVFLKCCLAVFIAEWGDRTQIAMVGQHASLPLLPVFLGSAVAFFLLSASAVMVASGVERMSLSERLVSGASALCFATFAALALRDILVSRA